MLHLNTGLNTRILANTRLSVSAAEIGKFQGSYCHNQKDRGPIMVFE